LVDIREYALPTNLQNFMHKDLTEVKTFQKVLRGYFFSETPCSCNCPPPPPRLADMRLLVMHLLSTCGKIWPYHLNVLHFWTAVTAFIPSILVLFFNFTPQTQLIYPSVSVAPLQTMVKLYQNAHQHFRQTINVHKTNTIHGLFAYQCLHLKTVTVA